VTVFGHGAGATSACLQAILPTGKGEATAASKRVTQAAIVESGACYAQPLGA
jgi:carboxylesterase type B